MDVAQPTSILVQKYGGSSLASPEALQVIAARIVAQHRAGHSMVVVVSAMGRTTEGLLAQGHALAAAPPRRELDMLVTAGERICMALLCIAIDAAGAQAISLTGSQSGIITDTQHQGARILEVDPWRIRQALGRGQITVVAGYQGVSRDREITTLGRGGSDTSAVALAAALGAEACEIYSDVDGVFDADPNLVPQARLLSELTYETMQTLADCGARVLNAQAVAFAKRADITILARRTGGQEGRQTRVSAPDRGTRRQLLGPVAVAHLKCVSHVTGAWLQVHAALCPELTALGARMLATESAGLWLDRTNMVGTSEAPVAAAATRFGLSHASYGWASLIGETSVADWLSDALVALAKADIAVHAVVMPTHALAFAVAPAALLRAVEVLYALLDAEHLGD